MLPYEPHYETRPWHFFIPALMVIVGGLFTHISGWEYVGYMIWIVAAACVFFLIYSMLKDKELDVIREVHSHEAEIMKLDAAQKFTRVAIQKTDLTNGYFSESYNTLDILPAQVKAFARGVLVDKRNMTIREWTPRKRGKTFSDGQWRTLIEFMKSPDKNDRHIKFIVPINPANEKEGYELTAAGEKWLRGVLEDVVITPPSP